MTEEEKAIETQETLLAATYLSTSGIKIAPGEGQVPLSLTKDSDLDVLAFPTVFGGIGRKFKIRLTSAQIAKAEMRSEDRRVPLNITLLFCDFVLCELIVWFLE